MRKAIFFLMLCPCFYLARAQQFDVSAVSETLKKNANVIVQLENINLDIESPEKATVKVQKIFTVLNEEGRKALFFNEYSNKYISLDEAEIRVYDQRGKQIARYKKKDMVTIAVGEGLVEDGYVTAYRITTASYPITIEFNYVQKLKSTIGLPAYHYLQSGESVIESHFTATVPSGMNLRYKGKNSLLIPEIAADANHKTYKWSVKNLPAMEDEEGTVSDKFPYIDIVTDQFSYYGNNGNLSSWKSFGSWINDLYKGLDELPAERQQFFQNLVKDAPNDREKVRRVYNYLQENFRYVSIQLGVGGLKPFPASFTDQKKYGDCKGLSNYMKAALKSVGIRSHVAIINAEYNEEPVDPDFPANNFNHVILCVPANKDSIWLECTSSTAEFGKLGTFTENRNALLITEDGGVLVPTPKSQASTNLLNTHTTVALESDLSAVVVTKMNASGAFSEMMADILKEKKDDQKEIIVLYLGYKEPDDFEFTGDGGPDGKSELKMAIRKLPEFNAGSKYFINPRVNKIWSTKLPSAENRKLDYYFYYPFEKHDTTIVKLGTNFQPDVLPKEKQLSNDYAFYQSRSWFSQSDSAIYTATTIILKKHKVLAKDYPAVKSFFDDVAQDDAQRIVVKKSEGANTEKKAF
jgi:transglutaminase-like putative cysteine protease